LSEVPTIEVFEDVANKDYVKKSLLFHVCTKKIVNPVEEMFIVALAFL